MSRRDETPKVWWNRLQEGESCLNDRIQQTQDYVRGYRSIFPASLPRNDFLATSNDEITTNHVKRITDSIVDNLFFTAPKIQVIPVVPSDLKNFKPVATGIMQKLIDIAGYEDSYRSALQEVPLRGCSWVKFGFDQASPPSNEVDVETDPADKVKALLQGQEVHAERGEDHDKHMAYIRGLLAPDVLRKQTEELLQGAMPGVSLEDFQRNVMTLLWEHQMLLEREQKRPNDNWRYKTDSVWAEHVAFVDAIPDPNGVKFKDCRWWAHRIVRTLEDVKKDDTLQYTRELKGMSRAASNDRFNIATARQRMSIEAGLYRRGGFSAPKATMPDEDPDARVVVLYEIIDRKYQEIIVLSEESVAANKFHRRESLPYNNLPGSFPVVQIINDEKPQLGGELDRGNLFGYPIIEVIWDEQLAINAYHTVVNYITKRALPIIQIMPWVESDVADKLMQGIPLDAVKVTSPPQGMEGAPALVPIQKGQVPVEMYTQMQLFDDMITKKSGLSDIQLNGLSAARNITATATEVGSAAQTASLERMLRIIEKHYVDGVRIIHGIATQWIKPDTVKMIAGEDGQVAWAAFSGESLMGVEIRVIPGSSMQAFSTIRMQNTMVIFNQLIQLPIVKQDAAVRWLKDVLAGVVTLPEDILLSPQEIAAIQQAQTQAATQTGDRGVDGGIASQASPTNPASQPRDSFAGPMGPNTGR